MHDALHSVELVALLAEGVDRNRTARKMKKGLKTVALLAEGVDRNKRFMGENDTGPCRPPRGGRG